MELHTTTSRQILKTVSSLKISLCYPSEYVSHTYALTQDYAMLLLKQMFKFNCKIQELIYIWCMFNTPLLFPLVFIKKVVLLWEKMHKQCDLGKIIYPFKPWKQIFIWKNDDAKSAIFIGLIWSSVRKSMQSV